MQNLDTSWGCKWSVVRRQTAYQPQTDKLRRQTEPKRKLTPLPPLLLLLLLGTLSGLSWLYRGTRFFSDCSDFSSSRGLSALKYESDLSDLSTTLVWSYPLPVTPLGGKGLKNSTFLTRGCVFSLSRTINSSTSLSVSSTSLSKDAERISCNGEAGLLRLKLRTTKTGRKW